jgi:acyl-coenzyme A thioesterase PaaI-like protein
LARAATSVGGIATRLPGRGRVEAAVRRLREGKAGLTLAGSRVVRTGDRLVVAAEEPARRRQEAAAATYPLVGAPFAAPHVVTDAELLIC